MLKDFSEIYKYLYSYFIQILEFYLYMKNDKMSDTKNSDDVILQYSRTSLNNKIEVENVLLCFSKHSLLSDYDKKIKILTFIKKLKDEIINKYG